MTDKGPSGQESSRSGPAPPDADLDAALWPAPAAQLAEPVPAEAVPTGVLPGRPAARVTVVPASAAAAPPVPVRRPPEDAGAAAGGPVTAHPKRPPARRPAGMPAREWLRRERARQVRRRRIRVVSIVTGVLTLIAAVAVGVLVHYHRGPSASTRPATAVHYAPVTLNADNSVTMAQPGVTKPVLDVFEDFRCQQCQAFERGNGRVIEQLAEQGKVKVVYHPFTLFSGPLQQDSSIRAWAAAKCVPAGSWVRYHNALYANEPALGTAGGFPVSQLVHLGRTIGLTSPGFAQCVRSQQYAVQNAPLSNQILNSGVNGAPILVLNGKTLAISPDSPQLRQLILSGP